MAHHTLVNSFKELYSFFSIYYLYMLTCPTYEPVSHLRATIPTNAEADPEFGKRGAPC